MNLRGVSKEFDKSQLPFPEIVLRHLLIQVSRLFGEILHKPALLPAVQKSGVVHAGILQILEWVY